MERKITNWKFWVFLLTLNFGLNAQNIVNTTQCTTSTNCDGTATVNPNMIGATTWNWQQDSVNILQMGGMTISNLCPGPYFLTFVDSLSNTIYINFMIQGPNTNPCANTTLTGAVTSAPCTDTTNCNGNIMLNVGGGVLPYQFQSNGIVYTTPLIQNLCPGVYVYTVVDSLGCSITLTGVVQGDTTVNPNPCANTTLAGTVTSTNNTSTNPSMCNGSVTLNVTGGVTPYTYTQVNGVVTSSGMLTNICPGIYPIYVTDANGCSISLTGVVNGDSTVINNPNPCNLFAQISTTNVSAFGSCDGSTTVYPMNPMNPNGSGDNYFYNWSNGATTATIDNLCSGIYTVTVYDTNGCIVTVTGYVGGNIDTTIYPNLPLNGYIIPTGETADGACDGNASVIIYGGVAPYTYLFSNGITTSTSSSLCSGLQSVLVTDNAGATLNLDFIISSPSNVVITNTYPDSTIIDSVYTSATVDCVIDFSLIDSAFISNFTILPNDSLLVYWIIAYNGTTATVTNTYGLGFGVTAGVYNLILQIYCPNKSIGNFLTATDQVYYNAAMAGIHEEMFGNDNVSVYPNPINDQLTISLQSDEASEIIITDITGKIVINKTSNDNLIHINTSGLSTGQYIVTVNNGTSIITRKIVK